MVETQIIEFNQVAMQRLGKTDDMFNRVMNKDNIATVALFEHVLSGARLIAVSVHIHWDPTFRDVKLVQTAMMVQELEGIANRFARLPPKRDLGPGYEKAPEYSDGFKIPMIICGDFNSVPESGVYEFLSRGSVGGDHADFMSHAYGNYTSDGLNHRFNLKSAYSHIGELPFTNYTPGFKDVIDYIWYASGSLSVVNLLGPVDSEYLTKIVGFPNAHYPSDHIPILAEFKITRPK